MTLEEARVLIGCKVVYRPWHGPPEDGVVTSVNDSYVFVRYRGNEHSAATRPESLETIP